MKLRAEIQKAYRKRRKKSGVVDMRVSIPKDLPEEQKDRIRKYVGKIVKQHRQV